MRPGRTGRRPPAVPSCRPAARPSPGCRSSTVTVPKSVCGPIRNWPGSGRATTSVSGGYRLMLNAYVGWSMAGVKKSRSSAEGLARSSDSSRSPARAIRARYSLDQRLQLGHLGGPHVRREPLGVDRPGRRSARVGRDREGLLQVRRGLDALGVAVGLHARWSQPRPPTVAAYALLDLGGQREERPAASRTPERSAGSTPWPVTSRNPAVCRAASTVRAISARTRRPRRARGQVDRSG